ncbi:MAG: hypothetical protein JWM21_3544 [Acidobacteria bacterium]|nr:hypothetical protein [Acidobacteriota bacterium]
MLSITSPAQSIYRLSFDICHFHCQNTRQLLKSDEIVIKFSN